MRVDVRAFASLSSGACGSLPAPHGQRLPSRLRRGTSELIRTLVDLFAALEPSLGSTEPLLVTGSAFGETRTACALIEAELQDPEGVSPARFKNSVHNTAAGLLGIATGNHASATALAAGPATFAMALLEGMSLVLATRSEALVLVADESLPEVLATPPSFATTGLGLLLAPCGTGGAVACLSDFSSAREEGLVRSLDGNAPWYPADFVDVLRAGRSARSVVGADGERVFRVHVEGPST